MNLPNFINFEPFNRLRSKMGTIRLGKFKAPEPKGRSPIRRFGPGAIAPVSAPSETRAEHEMPAVPTPPLVSEARDEPTSEPEVQKKSGAVAARNAQAKPVSKKAPARKSVKKSARKKSTNKRKPAANAKKS